MNHVHRKQFIIQNALTWRWILNSPARNCLATADGSMWREWKGKVRPYKCGVRNCNCDSNWGELVESLKSSRVKLVFLLWCSSRASTAYEYKTSPSQQFRGMMKHYYEQGLQLGVNTKCKKKGEMRKVMGRQGRVQKPTTGNYTFKLDIISRFNNIALRI